MRKKTPAAEKRTFLEIINSIEKKIDLPTYEEIAPQKLLSVEAATLREAGQEGLITKDYIDKSYLSHLDPPFDSVFEDPLWPYRYLGQSLYSRRVEKFKSVFTNEQLKIIIFEQLIDNPAAVIGEILDFANLSKENQPTHLPHKNKTKIPANYFSRALIMLKRKIGILNPVWEKMKDSRFQSVANWIQNIVRQRPGKSLSPSGSARVRALLSPEYEYWRKHRTETKYLWKSRARNGPPD
jgi:hypothetical protein